MTLLNRIEIISSRHALPTQDSRFLYFRTWQGGAFTLQMMYVDDISIPEPAVASQIKLTSVITMRLNRDAETGSIPLPV